MKQYKSLFKEVKDDVIYDKTVKTKWGSYQIVAEGSYSHRKGSYSANIFNKNGGHTIGWDLETNRFGWEDWAKDMPAAISASSKKDAREKGIDLLKKNIKKYV